MGGVCRYDLVKARLGDERERTGFSERLRWFSSMHFPAFRPNTSGKIPGFPAPIQSFIRPPPRPDCRDCDTANEVQRGPRDTTDPVIHYGAIALGSSLIQDAAVRRWDCRRRRRGLHLLLSGSGRPDEPLSLPCDPRNLRLRRLSQQQSMATLRLGHPRCVYQGAPNVRTGPGGS